ncbi:MAG: hypothetical protein ACI9H6_000882, partial [Patiriisocius sp.]
MPNPETESLILTTEMMYIGTCLYPENPFTQEIIREKGLKWLEERLKIRFIQRVPYAVMHMETQLYAVESSARLIYAVYKKFPKEIGSVFELSELALARRSNLKRIAKKAYKEI